MKMADKQEKLRVLIPKETLDKMKSELASLRHFHGSHKECNKEKSEVSDVMKEGGGNQESENDCGQCQPDLTFNENLTQVLRPRSPEVEIKDNLPNEEKSSISSIPYHQIMEKLWKKNVPKATKLLQELDKSGRFTIDNLSMVSVDGVALNISIFTLMTECFQSKNRHVGDLDSFVKLIKTLNLQKYVTNKYLLLNDNVNLMSSPYWFYIGD